MGLDNSIVIQKRLNGEEVSIKDVLEEEYSNNYFGMITGDVCYWRKFWGFRNIVMHDILKSDEYKEVLSLDDLIEITVTLEKFLEVTFFENNAGNSVWSWREYVGTIAQTVANMRLLIDDIVEGRINLDEYEILWVDSY